MDTFRRNRFIGVLSSPGPSLAAAVADAGGELHEDDVFWSGSNSPEPPKRSSNLNPAQNANPSRTLSRRISEKTSGILAALPEDSQQGPILQRKPSISSSSASISPSSTSSARMIPAIPKHKTDYGGGKTFHQSASVNISIAPSRYARSKLGENGEALEDDDVYEDDDEMLPPHEIVSWRSGAGSPMTTFSVLEGVGRTLKGRDLRRVRNAVWRKTGFVD